MHRVKEVSILVITCRSHLVLQCSKHQGYEVLQLPGCLPDKLPELIKCFVRPEHSQQVHEFGRAVDVIIKQEETVELVTDIRKIEIDDPSLINLPEGFSWYSQEEIASDSRGKRDARFHLRMLDSQPIDLEFSEKQPERWIDSEILYWREPANGIKRD